MTASVPGESNKGVERQAADSAFPRRGRLLRHADFERVYKQGRRHFSPLLTAFYLQRQGGVSKLPVGTGLRIGITVSRALGGAVQRNRIKRRIREAVRLSRPWPVADVDAVFNPKKVVLTASFEQLLNEVRQAFVVIEKKVGKHGIQGGSRGSEAGSRG